MSRSVILKYDFPATDLPSNSECEKAALFEANNAAIVASK